MSDLVEQPGPSDPGRDPARVQSVERAAAILRAVAAAQGSAASAPAIALAVGLNRTTTWRILATLEQQRLVSLDRDTGWWALGFGLLDLAEQAGEDSLVRSARSVLRRVAAETGETAALAMLREGSLTYVDEVRATSVVSARWQGRQVPLHATSTGKALLAGLVGSGPADLRELLGLDPRGRLPRYTSTTITSLAALEDELAATRERGFATCRGEFETSAWGVSAPVRNALGRPVAVLSIWGPGERLTADRLEPLGEVVVAGAEAVAGRPASRS